MRPSHHCDALEVRTPDRSDPVKDVTGWPANPNLVRHLKSTLIWTGVHVDEAVMGLSVHTDEDGGGDNPRTKSYQRCGTGALAETYVDAAHCDPAFGRSIMQGTRRSQCQQLYSMSSATESPRPRLCDDQAPVLQTSLTTSATALSLLESPLRSMPAWTGASPLRMAHAILADVNAMPTWPDGSIQIAPPLPPSRREYMRSSSPAVAFGIGVGLG